MSGFLEQVADYYMAPERLRRIEDYTFVFPNRRSGRFLKRYIQLRSPATMFMPRFTTIGSLVARLSGSTEVPQRRALFELYAAYRAVLEKRGAATEVADFDKFIFWGRMILNDFDEIDRNGVDADALYTNLDRLHEISADFLDESQKEVVRELWGDSAVPDAHGHLWNHIDYDGSKDIQDKFLTLWQLLPDIYHRFVERLREQGLTTAGRQYREAYEVIRKGDTADVLAADTHFVFVGFNSPSVMEQKIFTRMKERHAADFFWDTSSPYISDGKGGVRDDTASFRMLGELQKRFPMPPDFSPLSVDTWPEITLAGVASNTAQAKLAAKILNEWRGQNQLNPYNPIETALILPDEGLLMHVLHSLPPELQAVNITMGLPFASTGIAALMRSVITLQLKARKVRDEWRFFYEDVLEVCGHPHLRSSAGTECTALHDAITGRNLYTLSHDDIASVAPSLAFIFSAVEDAGRMGGVRDYLISLLDGLIALLGGRSDGQTLWELKMLESLRDDVEEIASMMQAYGIEAGERSYLVLFERTLLSITKNMAGTPLRGLQVMSMGETRALDFENVIVLSMNERIFPQRSVVKTMIPNFLRRSFGLPPTDRAENDAAYYFYRLIGRAKRVALLYDSRDASSGSGEVSRFITQLRYLFPAEKLKIRDIEIGGTAPDKRHIEIEKKGVVAARLARFRAGGPYNLSASALKNFKHCGLKFYLQNVCRLSGEKEVTEFMDMASFGTIFHALAQKIYDDYKGIDINAAILKSLRQNLSDRYGREVHALINKIHYNRSNPEAQLPLEGEIMRDLMIDIAKRMFAYEEQKWCIASGSYQYLEGEMKVTEPWHINPGLSVNFKMVIDRVDRTPHGLRFIDYKTGRDHIEVSFDEIFDPEHIHSDAVLQILAYCEAYASVKSYDGPIQPSLYVFLDMMPNAAIRDIMIDGEPLTDYRDIRDRFQPLLHKLIEDIFDEDQPFVQAPEGSPSCKYCMFAPMCGRINTD